MVLQYLYRSTCPLSTIAVRSGQVNVRVYCHLRQECLRLGTASVTFVFADIFDQVFVGL